MKFINYLESITDVSIYPLASMFIFVIFFVGVSYRVLREDKASIEEQKRQDPYYEDSSDSEKADEILTN